MRADLEALVHKCIGHFEFESGHHGDTWLDLERLFLAPGQVRPLIHELADQIAPFRPDVICGPLIEGAYAGLMIAERLGVDFVYCNRENRPGGPRYLVPKSLQASLRGRRTAIVNDVINAGSAVQGALSSVVASAAKPVALAALLVLGDSAQHIARERGIPLRRLDEDSTALWTPDDCPLCAAGEPLTPHPGF